MTSRRSLPYIATCGCGKRGYRRRKDAKEAAKRVPRRPGYGHADAYRCKLTDSGLFHVGALPLAVVQGIASRDEIVVRTRPAPAHYYRGVPLA